MNEVWREISGYEELYEVSDLGRVRSKVRFATIHRGGLRSYGGKVLRHNRATNYPQVCLSKNNIRQTFQVHRLVLETFVGKRPEGMEARHLNGNSDDPRLVNLEWGTHSENMKDRSNHGTWCGESCNKAKLTNKKVLAIRSSGKPQPYLADKYGVTRACISDVIRRKTWTNI